MKNDQKISLTFSSRFWLKTFPVTLLCVCIHAQQLLGQFSDDFTDGEFVTNPAWTGDNASFTVDQGLLRLQAPTVSDVAHMATASQALYNATWEFFVKLDFNPSGSNFAQVYLASDQPDLSGSVNGYFVLIGDTPDEISLYEQSGGITTKIIDGMDGRVDLSPVNVRVRVTRDATGNWELYSDVDTTGVYTPEGSVNDVTHTTTQSFGVLCVYTSTRSDKFHFDDFAITGEPFVDLDAPELSSVTAVSADVLEVVFSEAVDSVSAEHSGNYEVSDGIGFPSSATLQEDSKTVTLHFDTTFTNGVSNVLHVEMIADSAGNVMSPGERSFTFFSPVAAVAKDVVITEIFADPTPVTGLPEEEFVEIFNRSDSPFDLAGWTLTDGTSTGTLSSLILLPAEYLILSSSAAATAYDTLGNTMGLPVFPSLNNSADAIRLLSPEGITVDSISYSRSWYKNEDKEDGGWTLEVIDPGDFCQGSLNWVASNDASGGTPGRQNSVFAIHEDLAGPKLLSASATPAGGLSLFFDEALQENTPVADNFVIEPPVEIGTVSYSDLGKQTIDITLDQPLDSTITYNITVVNVDDCPGNPIQDDFSSIVLRLDTLKPGIVLHRVISQNELDIVFTEEMDSSKAESVSAYEVAGLGNPSLAELQAGDTTVRLTFEGPFVNGVEYAVAIEGLTDLAGNVMDSANSSFMYFVQVQARFRDIVISEIHADPAPAVSLPEAEYIEIHNRSADPFDLSGWQITDGSGTGVLTELILLPDEYLILCSGSSAPAFSAFGKTMGLSAIPTLNNASDNIRLISAEGIAVDSVEYSVDWHGSDEKSDGGWSLELIDPEDVCRGSLNWTSSTDPRGGTPGSVNSVFAHAPDTEGPKLLSVSQGEGILELVFDEQLDRVVPAAARFMIDPSIGIDSVSFADAGYSIIQLALSEDLNPTETYTIAVDSIFDCPGNIVQPQFSEVTLKLDTISPSVMSVSVVTPTELDIVFTEEMDSSKAESVSAYEVAGLGNPSLAELQAGDTTVRLTFEGPFVNGVEYAIAVEGLTDLAGNVMDSANRSFMYFVQVQARFRDIVISEIHADPAPAVSLPEAEYIEIHNRSADPFDLSGWQITDGSGTGVLTELILLPDEYLILCSGSSAPAFSALGKTMGLSAIPTLNNASDNIRLISAEGIAVDSVEYSVDWHGSDEKSDGGWSLELIDPEDVCRGPLNWTSSTDPRGGTPGSVNSVFAHIPDLSGPRLLEVSRYDHAMLLLEFDETLDKRVPNATNFSIEPNVVVEDVSFAMDQRQLLLSLSADLDSTKTYRIKVDSVFDCPGNLVQPGFDELELKLDTISPGIVSLDVVTQRDLELRFNEKLDHSSSENVLNYSVQGVGAPASAKLSTDERSVRLSFADDFTNGVTYDLRTSQVRDLAGNPVADTITPFMFFQPSEAAANDIVISEILADPAPQAGLPETEFLEILNRSDGPFQLAGWRLIDLTSSIYLPARIILPGEHLILCPVSGISGFPPGSALGVPGFPTLNNSGEPLVLKSPEGLTIDSVNYSSAWYRDDEKADGGWTLELIDPANVCAESGNWVSSENEKGGTPGQINSVHANKPDLTGPLLVSAFPPADSIVELVFNEKLGEVVPPVGGFIADPPLTFKNISFGDRSLRSLNLVLSENMDGGVEYRITAADVYDCAGNRISEESNSASFALPEVASAGDVVINEILFNPRPTGVDFIEVYNLSTSFIDLKDWKLANLDDDSIKNPHVIFDEHTLLAPGDYMVFTEDGNTLKGEYLQGKEEAFFECSLPSLPDDGGSVAVTDANDIVIDELHYSEDHHSPLLRDVEGVSLERISFHVPGNDPANWRSATTGSGYATPGYTNSNSRIDEMSGTIQVEPEVFAPQSGMSEFIRIAFSLDRSGYIANVKILDPNGREVKRIASNELIGAEGFFRWDGDRDSGDRARIGSYMVWIELFEPGGTVRTYRKRVVVAGKF